VNEKYWLAVASRDHVQIGVHSGFAQVCHGRRGPLASMQPNDWLIYYSPGHAYGERGTLKAFTALGRIADDHVEQIRLTDDFIPWRRSVHYETSMLPLAETDFDIIATSMRQQTIITT
jgi:hypothetical protein